jgi:hypothetical protein
VLRVWRLVLVAQEEVVGCGAVAAALTVLKKAEGAAEAAESGARLLRVLAGAPRLRVPLVEGGAVGALLEAARVTRAAALVSEATRGVRLLAAAQVGKAAVVEGSGLPVLVWLAKGECNR